MAVPNGEHPVIEDVLREHFEELEWLWVSREQHRTASQPVDPEELVLLEDRAEAHLDALRIGGARSVELARPALSGTDAGLATAATMVFFVMGDAGLADEVVTALENGEVEARNGIRLGLRHVGIGSVRARLTDLAERGSDPVRVAAVDVLAAHGDPVPRGFDELRVREDLDDFHLVLEAVGRFKVRFDERQLRLGWCGATPEIRRAALSAAARTDYPGLRERCCEIVAGPEATPEVVEFLGEVGEPGDYELLQSRMRDPELALAAIAGLGALGNEAAVDALIEVMSQPGLAHAAGRAFVRITGAEDVEADAPLEPPEDLSEDEREFWDESLPVDPVKARAWWEAVDKLP